VIDPKNTNGIDAVDRMVRVAYQKDFNAEARTISIGVLGMWIHADFQYFENSAEREIMGISDEEMPWIFCAYFNFYLNI